MMLESESESESWILENPGIGIRIGISPSGIGIGIGITGSGIIYNSGLQSDQSYGSIKVAPSFFNSRGKVYDFDTRYLWGKCMLRLSNNAVRKTKIFLVDLHPL